jgi:hypothetical protein
VSLHLSYDGDYLRSIAMMMSAHFRKRNFKKEKIKPLNRDFSTTKSFLKFSHDYIGVVAILTYIFGSDLKGRRKFS